MHWKTIIFSVLIIGCLAACANNADKKWVRDFPKPNQEYKYYVGRGSSDKNEADAFNQAVKDAYDQAARENFGLSRTYNSEFYQIQEDIYLTERTVERAYTARFDHFDKVDQQIEKSGSTTNVWLLYRFSVSAIAKEQQRLALKKKPENRREMSVVGTANDLKKGALIVITNPTDGAVVYIDGERFGQTPIKLIGALTIGQHDLRIDHPDYDTIREKIVVIPNKTITVEKTMKPALTTVALDTVPVKADVYYNDVKIGVAPVKFKAEISKPAVVKFVHSETQEMTMALDLKKSENKKMEIRLMDKPSQLSVYTFPQEGVIFIDDKKQLKVPVRDYALNRGRHSVEVRAAGYEYQKKIIDVRGGENLNLTFELKQDSSVRKFVASQNGAIEYKNTANSTLLPEVKKLKLPANISAEEALITVMNWSYPVALFDITARPQTTAGITEMRIDFALNETKLKTDFFEPLNYVLSKYSLDHRVEDIGLLCDYENSDDYLSCQADSDGLSNTIMIQNGLRQRGLFRDTALFGVHDFYSEKSIGRDKIKPYEKYAYTIEIYDRNHIVVEKLHGNFVFSKFSRRRDGNIIFAPSYLDGAERFSELKTIQTPEHDISKVILKVENPVVIEHPFLKKQLYTL